MKKKKEKKQRDLASQKTYVANVGGNPVPLLAALEKGLLQRLTVDDMHFVLTSLPWQKGFIREVYCG